MPTNTLDVSTDWTIFDNLHTVSLTGQGGSPTVTGKYALKETITDGTTRQGDASVPDIHCRWHLFVDDLGNSVPEKDGFITDEDGVRHYINDIDFATWDTRFVCSTTAQSEASIA